MNLFFLSTISTIFFFIPIFLHHFFVSRTLKINFIAIRFFANHGIKILLTLSLYYLIISLSIFLTLFILGFKLDWILWFLSSTIPAPISSSVYAFNQLPKAWNHVFRNTIKPFTTFFDSLDVSDELEKKATLFVEATQDFVNAVGNHYTPDSLNVEVDVYSLSKPISVQLYRILITILHSIAPHSRSISFQITEKMHQTFSQMIITFNDVLDVTDLSSILPEISLSENCFTLFTPLKKSVKDLLSSESLKSIVAKFMHDNVTNDLQTKQQLQQNLIKSLKAFTNQCDILERVADLNKNSPEVKQSLLKLREISSITELRDMFIGEFKTHFQQQLTKPGIQTLISLTFIFLVCAILKYGCLWILSRNGIRKVNSNAKLLSSRKAPLLIGSITGIWFAVGEVFLWLFSVLLLYGMNLITWLSTIILFVHAFTLIPSTAALQSLVSRGIGQKLGLKAVLLQTVVNIWWSVDLNFLLVFIMTGSTFGKLMLASIDLIIITLSVLWEQRLLRNIDGVLISNQGFLGNVV